MSAIELIDTPGSRIYQICRSITGWKLPTYTMTDQIKIIAVLFYITVFIAQS